MSSPFLAIPASAWVASNALAFAVRDLFPVSPGHTLVIPRRQVKTWFDATREEQLALLELVDAVKRQLDGTAPKPDGYNVGFNAGEAAGQTVMHLHVHVIPRYQGDMEDPRGGVRHVIPAKGNYLAAPPPASLLVTGGKEDPFLQHLLPLWEDATGIHIIAAFVQQSGLADLKAHVFAALERTARIRIITGDYLAITQVAALEELLDWSAFGKGLLEARVVETARLSGSRSFHPKAWRFESPRAGTAFVGSSNVSHSALGSGIEWNLRLDRRRDPEAWARLVEAFEHWWARARPLDAEWIAAYAERAQALGDEPLPLGEEDAAPL
ncbi:MAG TPA: HIT domain-containing protein, partial [Myxococcaceae bacterium]|nr:HIT domain-containing protein [Myxococcaceae bacterium]